MGFGPTYVAHIPPIVVWYNRDSLCYGVGARVAYITAKAKKKRIRIIKIKIRSLVQQRFALLWGRGVYGLYNCKCKK